MVEDYIGGEILVYAPQSDMDGVEDLAKELEYELKGEWDYGENIYVFKVDDKREEEACQQIEEKLEDGWARRIELGEEDKLDLVEELTNHGTDMEAITEEIEHDELTKVVKDTEKYIDEFEEKLIHSKVKRGS